MNERKVRMKIFLSILLVVISLINGVVITIYNVDKSSGIGEVSEDIRQLKTQNNRLTEEISTKDSLSDFSVRSADMGFSDKVNLMYFNQAEPVAQIR